VWAVFTPSVESGIGVNGKPKNTAFGLYRDGTELRGIYPSHKENARKACRATGPFACDYPVIIGNDPFYGGLGGEFVISTSSVTSGIIVIRHELGHNLIPVGEEYDGGWVYDGVNAAHSLPAPWTHWLTNLTAASVEERNRVLFQEYPWLDLAGGPWRKIFYTEGHDGGWERVFIQASASGVPEHEDLLVTLDGVELAWNPTMNDDRRFLEWNSNKGFAPGFHVIEFRQLTEPKPGQMPRQLCSIEIIEYGPEEEYHREKVTRFLSRSFEQGYIGNFPTYDIYGRKTWRPTNEGCLMRHMSETTFCPVCQEGLWTNLLLRLVTILKECC
jgi:IgA Peptidase M64